MSKAQSLAQQQVFQVLEYIAETIPAPFCWMDLSGKFLGLNMKGVAAVGAPNKEYVIGKNVYELYKNDEIAGKLQQDIDKVIKTGVGSQCEDKIVDTTTGETRYYMATREPLRNLEGEIIGIIGTSIEITAEKNKQQLTDQQQIFQVLESIAENIPAIFYFMSLRGEFLGINKKGVLAVGATNKEYIIGKNVYELYKNKDIAEKLQQDIDNVIKTGVGSQLEDKIIDTTTDKTRYYMATREPLRNFSGEIIGVIGISIEITAEKEKEHLEIQNAVYEAELKAQKVFKECMNGIQHLIQETKINVISNKTGKHMEISDYDKNIVVTKREKEILYFLSMGKAPKEIASVLSIIDGKNVSSGTVSAFINKQLYPKFEVFNISQLLEKVTLLKLIPFLNEELL